MTGLLHGVSYSFVVTAATEASRAVSAASNAVTPFWSPTAPTGVVATAGDSLATVGFNPPSLLGDSPIDHYTVTASPGGNSAVGSHPDHRDRPRQRLPLHLHGEASNANSTGPRRRPRTWSRRRPRRIVVDLPTARPGPRFPTSCSLQPPECRRRTDPGTRRYVSAMPSPSTLAVFCAAALALIVVPGPAVTYIVTQSIDKGRSAGLVSALGSHRAASCTSRPR